VAGSFALAAVCGAKTNPGGPFISILGDLLPSLTCCGVIAWAWRSLRHGPLWRRLLVAIIALAAAALINLIAARVVSFWLAPYSRGALIAL
jgi:hypothetical protein